MMQQQQQYEGWGAWGAWGGVVCARGATFGKRRTHDRRKKDQSVGMYE